MTYLFPWNDSSQAGVSCPPYQAGFPIETEIKMGPLSTRFQVRSRANAVLGA